MKILFVEEKVERTRGQRYHDVEKWYPIYLVNYSIVTFKKITL